MKRQFSVKGFDKGGGGGEQRPAQMEGPHAPGRSAPGLPGFLTTRVTETMMNRLDVTSHRYSCGSSWGLGSSCSSTSCWSSGDDLRLPGLTGHLGPARVDGQRAQRGLAVQAEAADQVLEDRALRLPLLWRRTTKAGQKGRPG